MEHPNIIYVNNQEFYLQNVIEQNEKFPRTFLIPSQKEIAQLKIDTLVKLVFVMVKPMTNGCRAEKMWIKLITNQNGVYTGTLNNEPYYLKSIKYGDTITFKAENIASIFYEKSLFNDKLFAIITKKALEKRQINWVVRTDDLDNEKDSGWQLFYGDESEEYVDDYKNAAIISLAEILSFEPLLENVFGSSGYAYEYSHKDNQFIEVTPE